VKRAILLIFFVLLLGGCAVHNLSVADLECKGCLFGEIPKPNIYQEMKVDFTGYKTFTVFPISFVSKTNFLNEIAERQVLFFLRNAVEEICGYRYVTPSEEPDLLFTVDVNSQPCNLYTPPSLVYAPVFTPPYTSTGTTVSWWGSWWGSSYTETYHPGQVSLVPVMKPGEVEERFCPSASVIAYDGKTKKKIWIGAYTRGFYSKISDVRISTQLLVYSILLEFPKCNYDWFPESKGAIGIKIALFTNDGNNYYPTVVEVIPNSPASKVGIKKYDMITSINGKSVVNEPIIETFKLLDGDPGTTVTLTIKRLEKNYTFVVKRESREKIYPEGNK